MNIDDVDLVSTRLPKAVVRSIDGEAARGLTRAARVRAAGFVAETALSEVELLSRMEAAVSRNDPIAAERVSGIIEDFVSVARSELRRMGRRL
jgi:hypothetical protein